MVSYFLNGIDLSDANERANKDILNFIDRNNLPSQPLQS